MADFLTHLPMSVSGMSMLFTLPPWQFSPLEGYADLTLSIFPYCQFNRRVAGGARLWVVFGVVCCFSDYSRIISILIRDISHHPLGNSFPWPPLQSVINFMFSASTLYRHSSEFSFVRVYRTFRCDLCSLLGFFSPPPSSPKESSHNLETGDRFQVLEQ